MKAMKEALEGDPKELFSALARISGNHYLVHAFDASSIQVSFLTMDPFRIYRGNGETVEDAISHLFHTYIGEHDDGTRTDNGIGGAVRQVFQASDSSDGEGHDREKSPIEALSDLALESEGAKWVSSEPGTRNWRV